MPAVTWFAAAPPWRCLTHIHALHFAVTPPVSISESGAAATLQAILSNCHQHAPLPVRSAGDFPLGRTIVCRCTRPLVLQPLLLEFFRLTSTEMSSDCFWFNSRVPRLQVDRQVDRRAADGGQGLANAGLAAGASRRRERWRMGQPAIHSNGVCACSTRMSRNRCTQAWVHGP